MKSLRILLMVMLSPAGCGYKAPVGHPCNPDVCQDGLQCIEQQQVTRIIFGTAVCEFDAYEICTKRCSSDADCASVGGRCTAHSSCGGRPDLCDD